MPGSRAGRRRLSHRLAVSGQAAQAALATAAGTGTLCSCLCHPAAAPCRDVSGAAMGSSGPCAGHCRQRCPTSSRGRHALPVLPLSALREAAVRTPL